MSWLPKSKVVVPIDFSDESLAALELARDTFVQSAENLYAVHVLPTLMPADPGVIWETVDDNTRRRHAEQALQERLTGGKWNGLNIEIAVGDAGTEIADFAKDTKAELVIMPSHGRTGLKHLLIGSVAERVVRLSHCPVLVLRS